MWDHSPSPSVFAYRVYYGTTPGIYPEFVQVAWPVTSARIQNLKSATTYYFAAKAVGFLDQDVESDFSNVLIVTTTNAPPTINTPAGMILRQNAGPQVVALTGITSGSSDGPRTLTVTAKSNNPWIAPDPEVRYSSPANVGTLIFTPNVDATGWVSFTVTVNNGAETDNVTAKTFWVFFNNPPTLDPIADVVVQEDSGPQTIDFFGVSSGAENENNQVVRVSAQSSNPNVIPIPAINYKNGDVTGLLTFAPAPNAYGVSLISAIVQDGQYGNFYTKRDFRIVVGPVNDPPTINPLSDLIVPMNGPAQIVELTGITSGAMNEAQSLAVTATSSDPTLVAPSVNYVSPATVGSLNFMPTPNRRGTATINITVNDGGLSNNIVTRSLKVMIGNPTIFAVRQISNDARTVTLGWSTDQPASCYVEYGPTSALGFRTVASATATSHAITLSNLTPGTVYSMRITASSAGGAAAATTMAVTENVATMLWSAESGQLAPPMAVFTNDLAQSSAYIGAGTDNSGTATYFLNAARGLNYQVWARINVPAGGDYLFASIDGAPASALFAPDDSTVGHWHWALLTEGSTTNAAVLQMRAGMRQVTITSRSPNMLVDEFAVSNDPQWQPILPTTKPRLTATRILESTARLEWTDQSGNAEFVGIEYSVDGVNFRLAATWPANLTSLAIGNLGSSTYYFRVFSYNSVDRTAYSNVAVLSNPF
jgi:hypothetical protein